MYKNDTDHSNLKAMVAKACKALEGRLASWEYGNEPDLYIGGNRPSTWSPADYVSEWQAGTSVILAEIKATCPSLVGSPNSTFMAPSIAGNAAKLSPTGVFSSGLNSGKIISQVSFHNYMGIATQSGTTLQGTLMSHSKNVNKINEHAAVAAGIAAQQNMAGIPYILGETNSLAGGGASGISNTLGAALWGMDFALQAAANGGIKRVHFHQNVNAPYGAWTPVGAGAATHAPYYGHLAAATFMGKSELRSVKNLTLSDDNNLNSVFAGYNTGTQALNKIAIINLRLYNHSAGGTRGNSTYGFTVMPSSKWKVQRLTAPGGDSTTGVTFGGYSYEYADQGQPKLVGDNTETVTAGTDGSLQMTVLDSEAAVLTLQ